MGTSAALPAGASAPAQPHQPDPRKASLALTLTALGVVYGDIGTSPLYALRECFNGSHAVAATHDNVLGVLSLVFWSLALVVVLKYLVVLLRADNEGEGGILALLALAVPSTIELGSPRRRWALVMVALFGAALLFGDGIITPAISVLGAIEGLEVATPVFKPYVVPITVGILIAVFLVQRHGTAKVGLVFGPATLLWFVAIGAAGVPWIMRAPEVLHALNPVYAARFFVEHGGHGYLVLGAVVLCITGGEALYADMGHFGRSAIRRAWFAVVWPALMLNYFGQGALLLEKGQAAAEHPFYGLVDRAWLYPMVGIATTAAVIASQALISGIFSLTRQAIQLGYSPRLDVVHTSGSAEGQIYVGEVNTALMLGCLALVLTFRGSSELAAAYGIAVTGTMGITSILFYAAMRRRWGERRTLALTALFLALDLAFFGANAMKLTHGGWVPVVVAIAVFTVMWTWKRGRMELYASLTERTFPMDAFLEDVGNTKPLRVPGTAVFMTANPEGAPPVLLHHFKHNKVLHEQVILLTVMTVRTPMVRFRDRVVVTELGHGFYRVIARYGFMQTPSVTDLLHRCAAVGLKTIESDTSYYLGRETIVRTGKSKMSRWRKALFIFISRNARSPVEYYGLPPNRVIELGARIAI